jgi:hypothetical protein
MAKSQKIVFDGKNWTFTPGENGSLVSDEKSSMNPTLLDQVKYDPVSKVIISPNLKDEQISRNKRQGIAKTLISGKSGY